MVGLFCCVFESECLLGIVLMRSSRIGLSLVELLTVMALIGGLVAIALPAVQQARGQAERVQCINNLRQVGIALQNYHSSLDEFPIGCVEWRSFDPDSRQLAWSAYLLPFLEQSNLLSAIDFELPFDHPANSVAATTTIEVFRCPTGLRGQFALDGNAVSDYGGIFGERISGPNSPAKGVMLIDIALREADVLDGLSNTLIVAEDTKSDDGSWINGRNIFDQAFAINAGPDFENDIRSEHSGGANGVRCDGSVTFLSQNMDIQLLAAICTRAGRELILQE